MRKSFLLKLLMLALCAAMVFSLFACDGGNVETEAPETEAPEATDPAETDPTESTPAETNPTESNPAETDPSDDPADTDPADTDPAETNPAETDPAETDPAETDPAGPTCDGKHELKAKGDNGHYELACEICGTSNGTVEAHTYGNDGITCTACGYVASCGGVHNYDSNSEIHWINDCIACGAKGENADLHTPVYADGKYACTTCGYVYTCPTNGEHAIESVGAEGHRTVACAICNAEAGEVVAHTFTDKNGSRFCECGYEAECKGVHEVTSTETGHAFAACDICGAAATDEVPHSEVKAEFVTDTAYVYGCADCGYAFYTKTLTDAVKTFLTPNYIAKKADNYYALGANSFEVGSDNMPYASFIGKTNTSEKDGETVYTHTTAQAIYIRSHEDMLWNQFASEGQQVKWDIGNATYLVVKVRTNNVDQQMFVTFSTTGHNATKSIATEQKVAMKDGKEVVVAEIGEEFNSATGYTSIKLPMTASVADEWTTYVIDLAKAVPEQMVKDSTTGTYIVDTLYLHFEQFAAATTVDVAYLAFVEGGWTEIGAVVDEENAIAVLSNNTNAKVNADTGVCVSEHAYEVVSVEGECTNVCAICGHNGGAAEHGKLDVVAVDGVYKYACTVCGKVIKDYGISTESTSLYWPAETLLNKLTNKGVAPDYTGVTGKYNNISIVTENGETFLRLNDAESNKATNGAWGGIFWQQADISPDAGRYMVIKVRRSSNISGLASLDFWITSSAGYTNTWATGSVSVSFGQDNTWHTIVVDLGARCGDAYKADENGNYGPRTIHMRPFGSGSAYDTTTDETFDIAYIAFFTDLNELKNIVAEETYEFSKTSTDSAVYDVINHACAGTHMYGETVEGTKHTVACKDCGAVVKTFDIPAEINYYADLGIMTHYGSKVTKYLYDTEAGVLYNNFTATGGCHFDLSGGNAGTAGSWTAQTYNSGKYVVIKYRSTASNHFYVGTADHGLRAGENNPARTSVGVLTASANWKVQVFEIPDNCATYTVNSDQRLYFMIGSSPASCDVAYLAVVDSLEEAILLLGENENFYLGDAYLNKNQECVGVCNYVYTADETATDGYVYACSACGTISDINFFKNSFSSGYGSNPTKYEGYTTFTFTGSGHLNLSYTGTDGRGGMPSQEEVVAGQYLAIKIRASLTGELQIRIGNTDELAANNWNYKQTFIGNITPDEASADEWRILIVDLAAFDDEVYEIGKKHGITLSTQGASAAGVTIDIAWVAVGDSVDEIKTLFGADDTTYYYYEASYNSVPVEKNLDGTPVVAE